MKGPPIAPLNRWSAGTHRARTIRFQETVAVVMCLLSVPSDMSTGYYGLWHEDDDTPE
jgi:hypothetical protein